MSTLFTLCSYLCYYAKFYQISTLKTYLTRIRTVIRDKGGRDILASSNKRIVKRTFRGLINHYGADKVRTKLPLTSDILTRLEYF